MFERSLLAIVLMAMASASAANFTVEQAPEGLFIIPSISYVQADVNVDGPNGLQMLRFEAGQDILIPLPRLNGQYKYEVSLTPQLTPGQLQAQQANRNSVDNQSVIDQSLTHYSGNFAVINNALVPPLAEPDDDADATDAPLPDPQPRVVLTPGNSDGIIRFSACVGGDCPDSPAFGSDTLRLQENNLRIHFDDTSTGSFPGNDWRLVANSSLNGGPNFFAINDATLGRDIATFEAGAPANSLYVDDDGDLGLNTTTPVVEIHVVDGDSPTLRLEQDGSAGFNAQTWDVAGNETNFFIRDVNGGSALPFRIQPGADENALVIDNEGQVEIGNFGDAIEADATLHVRSQGNGDPAFLVQTTGPVADILSLSDNGDMILSGTLAQLSRQDSKEHFEQVNHQAMLAALRGLDISTWNYKHQSEAERHIGPMAEAFYTAYGLGTDAEHIATSDMAAVALASSQALLFKMEDELETKDQRIAELEARLQRLEALMVQVLDQREDENTQQVVSR